MSDNEYYRHGSARWSTEEEIAHAGLLTPDGLHIGYSGNRRLALKSDSPGLIFGGAGSGKARDWGIEAIIRHALARRPLWVLDPRGELLATTILAFAKVRSFVYSFNPYRLHGLANHGLNPLDILQANDPRLHADCAFISASLIPLSGSANGQYFELRARQWIDALLKSRVERDGHTSFPVLARQLAMIESDPVAWDAELSAMEPSIHPDVRVAAGEIWQKQQNAPREFGAILGTIKAHLHFLNDPTVMANLDGADLSLRDLTDTQQTTSFFALVPMEYIGILSPLLRVLFTVSRLYKGRAPQAPRLTMIVDEAGQMGRFESLLQAFTFGRGEGVRTIALFQDVGQIIRNFDPATLQSFIGSAQLRTFFGVRDFQTAQLISNMLGNATLEYDDERQQENAERYQRDALRRFVMGGDEGAAFDYAHYRRAAQMRSKMQRPLMTPDEILAMEEDRQITFVSGLNLHPLFSCKRHYDDQKELNGLWLPNPFHPPHDKVRLRHRLGSRWQDVITAPVPPQLAHLPQYADGVIRYLGGIKIA